MTEKHAMLKSFFGMSLQRSRVIRFLTFCKGLLFDLFFDTIIFGVLYPSDNNCRTLIDQVTCTHAISQVSGIPVCAWNQGGNSCHLNPPPRLWDFILIVAIFTTTISKPFGIIFDLLIDRVLTKRPRLEEIGLSSDYWLGPQVVDPMAYSEVGFTDDVNIIEMERILTEYCSVLKRDVTARNVYVDNVLRGIGLVCSPRGVETTSSGFCFFQRKRAVREVISGALLLSTYTYAQHMIHAA
jgi:hypothetical protein